MGGAQPPLSLCRKSLHNPKAGLGSGLCWGVGETVWNLQAMATGEIPYPGPADFFHLAGYPLIFAGVVLLPCLRPGRIERLRLAIDATAGSLSLGVVMWVSYLSRVTDFGGTQAPLELLLNLVYPFGDVLVCCARRRSRRTGQASARSLGAIRAWRPQVRCHCPWTRYRAFGGA